MPATTTAPTTTATGSDPGDRAPGLIGAATDLLLGSRCAGCAVPRWGVCPECRAALSGQRPRSVVPDPSPSGFPPTFAAADYAGVCARLVAAYKEEQVLTARGPLAAALSRAVAALLTDRAGPVLLVPMPSAPQAVRRRGLDATGDLARGCARLLRRQGRQVGVRAVLRQQRRVADQAGLSARERQRNLAGALRASGRWPAGVPAVIVDDVTTTGASLAEAARALRGVGIEVCGAAVVAATRRTGGSRR